MRTIRPLVGLLLLTSAVALPARAQEWYALTYQPAQPLGNTQDFTDNFGWRGIGFDFKKMIKPKLAVGIALGWQVFDFQTDQVIPAFGVDISGDQFRYVNSWPILANINYFFGSTGRPRPYVAANVGTYLIEQRLDIGLYSIHETNFHFGLAPEAGVAIPMQKNLALFVNGRYNYAFAAGVVDDQSYVSFGLGVAWTHGR